MRWIHFAAMFLLFGSTVFWLTNERDWTPGRSKRLPLTFRWTIRLVRLAVPCAALSGIAWLALTIADTTGGWANAVDPGMLRVFVFDTPFGAPSVVRLLLLGLLVALAVVPLAPRFRIFAIAAVSAALLVSQAWLGHAAQGGDTLYGSSMILAYAVHVLAAAAWTGGLPVLARAIREQRCAGDRLGPYELLLSFSTMAIVAVSLIVVSGLANTMFRVGDAFAVLASTAYGDVLGAKLGLVAAMLCLAAVNRFVLMPCLRGVDAPQKLRTVQTSLVAECVLGLVVILAAALLGVTPPPR